ncbi:hypothetical protein OR62_10130 [Clostridium tetani]|uniref:Uncharacterized protein n=1 Tax=Clostridium tetani TaxID=1513 RepID=A0ABY0ENK2_CLOTA|nr:hypothetical protein OR62_10130 [Clostridium tetani]RXI54963.1 hypothetical protein DP131_09565 [Clostridium tetani]RXI71716.1 hypothetical protein DQN76_04530 [Clostridium tetani]
MPCSQIVIGQACAGGGGGWSLQELVKFYLCWKHVHPHNFKNHFQSYKILLCIVKRPKRNTQMHSCGYSNKGLAKIV